MTRRPFLFRALLTLGLLASASVASQAADRPAIPAALAGRVETGVPSFVVYGAEAVGMASTPTDLKLLPDGRILLVNGRELAFGDGVRWEVARAADGIAPVFRDVAVAADGQIYYGLQDAIGRVELGTDGRWRAIPVYHLPANPESQGKTMISVTKVEEDFYWFSGTGLILDWRPGKQGELLSNRTALQVIFRVNGRLFVSDVSAGGLYEVGQDGLFQAVPGFEAITSEAVVSTIPFGDGRQVLIGTNFRGLRLFDGTKATPFGEGVLQGGLRINALCAAGEGRFAAAIDTLGIVFFDRQGRVLQTLEGSLDHRLERVERLEYTADGVLWALLNQGVARVNFPAPISRFEALIPSGLTYVRPVRHRGDLWLLADGRALRGNYDSTGKLTGFVRENPPGRFVFTLQTDDEELFAGTDEGLYRWSDGRWSVVAPGVVNARIGFARLPTGESVFVAKGEIGTLRRRGSGYDVERIPVPGLGEIFHAHPDANGAWLELGHQLVGRIDSRGAKPTIRLHGREAGLKDGWVAAFVLEGEVRFQLPGHLLRFDATTERFVEDTALLARFPVLKGSAMRPVEDRLGRVWYSTEGTVYRQDLKSGEAPVAVPLPFPVIEAHFQEDGVAWFAGDRRLARYDSQLAIAQDTLPRVLITAAKLPNSGRTLPGAAPQLGKVPFTDNTVAFNFVSPGNPPSPVWFEVQLAGLTDQWVSTGSIGQAVFNRLKEGRYVFQVRAVRAGGFASPPASIQFEIQPPWFRSTAAWFAYVLTGSAVLASAIWYPSVRQRRENARLERLVRKRTEELHATNHELERQVEETTRKSAALAISEERYRGLSAQLEQRVQERTAELSVSNLELQQRESLFRLIFEHAPVGISWKRADLDNLHHFNGTYRKILDLKTETHPDFGPLRLLVHPDDTPALSALETRITGGALDSDRLELRFIVGGTRVVWASICVAVVRDQGRIIQVIGILEDITARKEAETQLAATYKELLGASRLAGMAEVATGVLHNVGNVLNSLNVSSNLLSTHVRQSRTESLVKLSALVRDHADDLGDFITRDPKGRLVPELLEKLAQSAAGERDWLLQEIASMQKNIDHIKDIVAMQQSYATVLGVVETLDPVSLFDDALRMNAAALSRHDVRVVREFLPTAPVTVEKGKVLQILTNVIRNAKYACDDGQRYGTTEKIVTLRVEPGEGTVRFVVRDNGIGIPPENLTRIFGHGFTTRSYGHGFGLHSSALAAREMKGTLTVASDGLGKGATFTLEIPAAPADAPLGTTPVSRAPFEAPAI